MQIELERGIAGVLFGASELAVIAKLGPPDKVWLDDNDSRNLAYFAQKIVFKIEPNGRLGWIEVHNRSATWEGLKPFETDREVLLMRLGRRLSEPHTLDDYGSMESYAFGDCFVELQYECGELTSFNFGVRYDEHDEPLWPSAT